MANPIKSQQLKKALIDSMKKNLGIISASCNDVGCNRSTYYDYFKNDPDFKNEIENITEDAIDFVESKLYENIDSGDTTAIIFYLKTKAKKRGYIERSEVERIDIQKQVMIIGGQSIEF